MTLAEDLMQILEHGNWADRRILELEAELERTKAEKCWGDTPACFTQAQGKREGTCVCVGASERPDFFNDDEVSRITQENRVLRAGLAGLQQTRAALSRHHMDYTHGPGARCPICKVPLVIDFQELQGRVAQLEKDAEDAYHYAEEQKELEGRD